VTLQDNIETGLDPDQTDDILDAVGFGDDAPPVQDETEETPDAPVAPADDPRISALAEKVEFLTSLLAQQAQGRQLEPAPVAAEPETPPDPTTTSPSDYVNWYAKKAVESAVAPLMAKLDALQQGLSPIQQQQQFVGAYHKVAGEMGVNAKGLAGSVGAILEREPDIAELAAENPERAARLAIRMAQLETKASAPAKPSPAKRPPARPTGAAAPSRVATTVPSSFGAAFQQSLQEFGVQPGADFQFSNSWGDAPTAEG
jgi:hypothetical protein